MKSMQVMRIRAVGVILVANVMAIGLANAQTEQKSEKEVSTVVSFNTEASNAAPPAAGDVLIHGGYNVGRGIGSQVPGCTGPVSFCNVYKGN